MKLNRYLKTETEDYLNTESTGLKTNIDPTSLASTFPTTGPNDFVVGLLSFF